MFDSFNRDSRRFELTDHGVLLLEKSVNLMRQAEETFDEIRSEQSEVRGLISISTTSDLAHFFLVQPLEIYKRCHPKVRIEIDLTPQMVDLVAERFDIAIRVGPLRDSGLVARKLSDRPLSLCATEKYLKLCGTRKTLADLASHDLISTGALAIEGFNFRPSIRANNMRIIHELVARNLGIGLIDAKICRSSGFKPVLQDVTLQKAPIFLVMPHSNPPKRVRELSKLIFAGV